MVIKGKFIYHTNKSMIYYFLKSKNYVIIFKKLAIIWCKVNTM